MDKMEMKEDKMMMDKITENDIPYICSNLDTVLDNVIFKTSDNITEVNDVECLKHMETLLDIFIKLRQVPTLFDSLSKLSETHEKKFQKRVVNFKWSENFIKRFSICCEELSTPQLLALWTTLLSALDALKPEKPSGKRKGCKNGLTFWIPLLSNLLMHARLAEHSVWEQAAKRTELLRHKTQNIMQWLLTSLAKESVSDPLCQSILSLCYAWGECHILLEQYQPLQTESENEIRVYESPWDLSCVHSYISNSQIWDDINDAIISRTGDDDIKYFHCLLLLQKIKFILQRDKMHFAKDGDEETSDLKNALKKTATHLVDATTQQLFQLHEISKENMQKDESSSQRKSKNLSLWSSLIHQLPLIAPLWPVDILKKTSSLLIKLAHDHHFGVNADCPDWVTILTGNDYLECKIFQASFVTILAQEIHELFPDNCKKEFDAIFTIVTDNFDMWVREAESNPRTQNLKTWEYIAKAGGYLNEMICDTHSSNDKLEVNLSSLIAYLKLLKLLPLQYLLPGNQTRIIYVILSILHACNSFIDKSALTSVQNICFEILMTILDGMRSTWFMDYVNCSNLMSWFVLWVGRALKETESLGKLPFKQILRKFVSLSCYNYNSLIQFETFINKVKEIKSFALVPEMDLYVSAITLTLEQLLPGLKKGKRRVKEQPLVHQFFGDLSKVVLGLIKDGIENPAFTNDLRISLLNAYSLSYHYYKNDPKKMAKWNKYFAKMYEFSLGLFADLDECLYVDYLQFFKVLLPSFETLLKTNSEIIDDTDIINLWRIVKSIYTGCLKQNVLLPNSIIQGNEDKLADFLVQKKANNLLEVVQQIISRILTLSTNKELSIIFKDMSCNKPVDSRSAKDAHYILCLNFWLLVPLPTFDNQKLIISANYELETISHVIHRINRADANDSLYLKNVFLPSLKLICSILQKAKANMRKDCVMLYFQILCQVSTFSQITDVSLCCDILAAVCEILNFLLVNQTKIVASNVPVFFLGVSGIMHVLLEKSDLANLESETNSEVLLSTTRDITRLFALMKTYPELFGKISPYLASEYVFDLQRMVVLPAIRETLMKGMFDILDLCGEHGKMLLQSNLPNTKKELFKHLLFNYTKHCRETGKLKSHKFNGL